MLMHTLGQLPTTDLKAPPLQEGAETSLDWDSWVSIDMIRQHTKTDDIPAVTDDQLKLYRKAAVEAAEQYTGLLLAKQRMVTEPIQGPRTVRPGRTTYKHRLQWPVADGKIYIYGGTAPDTNRAFLVPPNTRTIQVPIRTGILDLSNCCDPCSQWNLNGGLMAMYKAGFSCVEKIPALVVLGVLQYIAWIIEHPGDEFLTARNRLDTSGKAGLYGSNNIALVSGALETWRQVDPEAI